jgi:nicotinate-nucleotide adenylyltransferase
VAAADQLGLERVLLIPARVAPHKQAVEDPGAEHRLAMCRLAARSDPRLEVGTLELDRPGPSFTVETLRLLREREPEAQLTLIMGADTARTLPAWREPREIVRLARLAVAERDGERQASVRDALEPLGTVARPAFIAMEAVDVSSSKVRALVASGEPVEELTGNAVASYIARHGLYRTDDSAREGDRTA